MKKYLFTIIMMIVCSTLSAQETNADEFTHTADSVVQEDADSLFFPLECDRMEKWVKENRQTYDTIMTDFRAGDSLRLDELYVLYYGYSFTKDYNPMYIEREASRKAFEAGEAQKAYELYKKDFDDNPVYLRTIYRLYLLANHLGYEEEAKKYYLQYVMLGAAMTMSGNGNEKHPIHVINVRDEYEIIEQCFGRFHTKEQSLHGMCDKLEVRLEELNTDMTIWFDCTRHLVVMEEMLSKGK